MYIQSDDICSNMPVAEFGYDTYKPDIQYNNPYLWPGKLTVDNTPLPRAPCSYPTSHLPSHTGQTSTMNQVLNNGRHEPYAYSAPNQRFRTNTQERFDPVDPAVSNEDATLAAINANAVNTNAGPATSNVLDISSLKIDVNMLSLILLIILIVLVGFMLFRMQTRVKFLEKQLNP